ncbi:uncharacterized protein LOC106658025 isoform X1 [Trichogramma pretiosum]|uniref:uncharacterized protein LOC106658025 isoform X1 n=1 Tax=Trichogramma pretiosum TaxID=7493 RepID=UPI0006C9401E|nr:uncharacterized protein LOC106658025 isoform X1 [Trichogramma pretiosum]XP_014235302.1 uncharacterized protein LOC106658025 isoform X1 [Trichogramma pretiosum]
MQHQQAQRSTTIKSPRINYPLTKKMNLIEMSMMSGCEILQHQEQDNRRSTASDSLNLVVDYAAVGLNASAIFNSIMNNKRNEELQSDIDEIVPTLIMDSNEQLMLQEQLSLEGRYMTESIKFDYSSDTEESYSSDNATNRCTLSTGGLSSNEIFNPVVGAGLKRIFKYFDFDYNRKDTIRITDVKKYHDLSEFNETKNQFSQLENNQFKTRTCVDLEQASKKRKKNEPKNVSCIKCTKKFRSEGHMKVHYYSHDPENNSVAVGCQMCARIFCHRGALNLHLMRKHKLSISELKNSDSKNNRR